MLTSLKNVCENVKSHKEENTAAVGKLEKKVELIDSKVESHLSGLDGKHKLV
jgi:hypothetical protein